MTTDHKIRDKKLQYINKEAAKISALSSGKIDKYEQLAGEEILPPDQRRVIEQAKFTYYPLGKALEKETRMIENQGEKQMKIIEEHVKKLVKSNDLIVNDFNIDRDRVQFEEQKKMFLALLAFDFHQMREKTNPNKLIYDFKTKKKITKIFSN